MVGQPPHALAGVEYWSALVFAKIKPGYALPVLTMAIYLVGCDWRNTPEDSASATQSPTVLPALSAMATTHNRVKAPCVVLAQRTVKLKPESGGAIESVHVKLGDKVSSGQLLAVLQTKDLRLTLARQEVQVLQLDERMALLQLQIGKAQREWSVQQSLYASPSAPGLQVAREAVLLAEKKSELRQVELQKQDLLLQKKQLQRLLTIAEVRSPMQGVVLSRNAEVGMVVAPGGSSFNGSDVLFEIGDPERLKAECAARESDATRLAVGAPMTLKLDGGEARTLAMKLSGIAPAVSNQGGMTSLMFWAEFEVTPTQRVLPGMHGLAQVEVVQEKVGRENSGK